MSFASLWIRKTVWLWGAFLFIAYALAFQSGIATTLSLIPVGTLFVCHALLKREIAKGARFMLFCIATGVSLALCFHFLPGFHNQKIVSDICFSPDSLPYTLWYNFDKPFIGIFVLVFSIPLIRSHKELLRMLKLSIPMSIAGIALLIGLSCYFGVVQWEPKCPPYFFKWAFANLFFVAIPEEAFFRGFVQREIYNWFGKTPLAGMGSILFTSLMFMLFHIPWVASVPFLCLVFVASVIYGMIYQLTNSIEGSILCHFGLNVVHLLLFTYPALRN
ncbi:MAG: CPBP family intramembrane metalloprotease [Verrucomicrobia bacterium]|nr:CPBP family intramembrane metalloprotease [Verrucomicrobiota bacterium]